MGRDGVRLDTARQGRAGNGSGAACLLRSQDLLRDVLIAQSLGVLHGGQGHLRNRAGDLGPHRDRLADHGRRSIERGRGSEEGEHDLGPRDAGARGGISSGPCRGRSNTSKTIYLLNLPSHRGRDPVPQAAHQLLRPLERGGDLLRARR